MYQFKCLFCEKEHINELNYKQIYCSDSCRRKYKYKNLSEENKKKLIQATMEYQKNPNYKKARSEYFKEWYKNHKEIQAKRQRDYYQKHKDKHNSRRYINRYRKLILEKNNNQCIICGNKKDLEIHHLDYSWEHNASRKNILNLNIEKIEVLCSDCHLKKHDRLNHKE